MRISRGEAITEKQPLSTQPLLRVVRCEHHYVFYLKKKTPVIIAVLHEKMDVMQRLAGRLE